MNHTPTIDQSPDIAEVLRLHREWWESNVGFDIPRMEQVFPESGREYLMFNFNGHPYFGIDEKKALWGWYRERIAQPGGLDVRVMRLEVRGDTAWLACEGRIDAAQLDGGEWTADGVDTPLFRATEIYHRDSTTSEGWRMWHTHISPRPEDNETRPGFADTTESRGLGWTPWSSPAKGKSA